jgi:hypothetical protein
MKNHIIMLLGLLVGLELMLWSPFLQGQESYRTVVGFDIYLAGEMNRGHDFLWEALPERVQYIQNQLGVNVLTDGEIHLLYELADYFHQRDMPNRAPTWAKALAIPQERLILLRYQDDTPLKTLTHELSHLAVYEAVNGERVPLWFLEGFAMLQAEEWGLGRSMSISAAAMFDNTLPFSGLENRFPSHQFAAGLAYNQSYHFVHRIIRNYGVSRLGQWLTQVRQGVPWKAAFTDVYGLSPESEYESWKGDVRVWYAWVPAITSLTTTWTLIGLLVIVSRRSVVARRRQKIEKMAREEQVLYPPDADDELFS